MEKGWKPTRGAINYFPTAAGLAGWDLFRTWSKQKHIPEAAALIPVGTKGTVIVAVDECFDLNNPDHLKRAHRVEARMAHIGLLDVTDTSLLS
ncbi:hypothetical protein GDR29_22165 [Xanthomonas oryzae pv. oryzae]|nr:hypothetical protein GDR29_22165 [Xanthomonas oryzae pv. oryzae]